MKDRGRSLRQSRSHKSSTPPATLRRHFDVDVADDKRRRPKASLSPKPDTEKNRNRPRHQARKDWVAEWEKQKSPITVEGSSHEFLGKLSKTSQTTILFRSLGGLLCVRSRSGWTSETLQSQPEEDLFAEAQKTPKKQESRIDLTFEVMSLKNELQKLHAENATRREDLVSELQDLIKQRNDLYGTLPNVQETPSASGERISAELSRERIQTEMERAKNELAFKAQVADILRTMLLKSKGQRSKVQSMSQAEAQLTNQRRLISIHDSSKSVLEGRQMDMQMSDKVVSLEREIANLEDHLKLLNDALDDEKQENYELAKENRHLREQVQSIDQKT